MSILTAAQAALLRTRFDAVFLNHTYTRTTYTVGAVDDWGTPSKTPTTVTGVACQYSPAQRGRIDASGQAIVYAPSITVSHADPLAEGDQVSAITDPGDGTVLDAGPFTVVSVVPNAGLGPELAKVATLQAGKVAG